MATNNADWFQPSRFIIPAIPTPASRLVEPFVITPFDWNITKNGAFLFPPAWFPYINFSAYVVNSF